MTPKRDHEEDMSMEEILASIRRFVTDNPPEDTRKQKIYKGDLSESVVIPPAGYKSHQSQEASLQSKDVQTESETEHRSDLPHINGSPSLQETDVLELKGPLPTKASPSYQSEWTPPSRALSQKKVMDESIMTLTNPIDTKKMEKSTRPLQKATQSAEPEETLLGSPQVMAASASSLARLAQASKSIPRKPPSLADQRNVTLDQLIQDMIRPMIKQWIDTHLPALVEEMVAKEIKRITKHLE